MFGVYLCAWVGVVGGCGYKLDSEWLEIVVGGGYDLLYGQVSM